MCVCVCVCVVFRIVFYLMLPRSVDPQSRKYYFLSEETDDRDRELQQQVSAELKDDESRKADLSNK